MEEKPRVTLILPAYNEGKSIRNIITRCREVLGKEEEILVVDDGSTDQTAQEAQKTSARLISHTKNQGKGGALRTGVNNARGDIIVVMDADGQDNPDDIPRLLKAQQEHDADFVNGSRFLGTLREGAISKINRLGTSIVDFILNTIFGVKITDSQAGFRCFRADKIRQLNLKSTWYDVETETVIRAHKNNFKIIEVPVTRTRREHGRSGHNQIKFALRFFKLLYRIYLKKDAL